jgi:hypothetical protein
VQNVHTPQPTHQKTNQIEYHRRIHVANEDTMVVAIPPSEARRANIVLRGISETEIPVCVSRVEARGVAAVVVKHGTGQLIPLDGPIGASLLRVC